MVFCHLAVIVMISGQPVQKEMPWIGGERTKLEGGLTEENCNQYVNKYNMTHEKQLVCVCK